MIRTFLLLVVLATSCARSTHELVISDASKDTAWSITAKQANPAVLKIDIVGSVDNDIKINGILVRFNTLPRTVFIDSYARTTTVTYSAHKAKAGKLKLKCSYN